MRKFILLISVFLISCQNKNIDNSEHVIDLPSDSLVNQVIYHYIKLNPIFKQYTIIQCALNLCNYEKKIEPKIEQGKIPPPPSENQINPITFDEFRLLFKSKMNFDLSIKDSISIVQQICSSRNYYLDTNLYSNIIFHTIDIRNRNDLFRNDSVCIFYKPIFTNDKQFVYINSHFLAYGLGMILKNENGNWKKSCEFDTWTTD